MSVKYETWPNDGLGRPWHNNYPKCIPIHLNYPREPLGWLLEDAANQFPERIACRYYNQQVSYRELFSQARQFAAALQREGFQPGDRVGVLLPNIPEYLVA